MKSNQVKLVLGGFQTFGTTVCRVESIETYYRKYIQTVSDESKLVIKAAGRPSECRHTYYRSSLWLTNEFREFLLDVMLMRKVALTMA